MPYTKKTIISSANENANSFAFGFNSQLGLWFLSFLPTYNAAIYMLCNSSKPIVLLLMHKENVGKVTLKCERKYVQRM